MRLKMPSWHFLLARNLAGQLFYFGFSRTGGHTEGKTPQAFCTLGRDSNAGGARHPLAGGLRGRPAAEAREAPRAEGESLRSHTST